MAAAPRQLLPTLALLLLVPVVRAEPPARTDSWGDPLPEGALARLGTTRFREGNPISAVALAPDGKALAVATAQGIRILDLSNGKELRTLKAAGLAGNLPHLAYSPDGKLLGATDYAGHFHFWDPATGTAAGQIVPLAAPGPFRGAGDFTFSGDGKFVAVASSTFGNTKGQVTVYEVATGKQSAKLEVLHDNGLRAVLSGDGKVLVTTGQHFTRGIEPPEKRAEIDSTIEVWDVTTGKQLHALRSEGSTGAGGAAFSPDGKQLAVVNLSGGLVVWDLAAGKELRRLAGRHNLNAFVTFSPDGKTLAAGSQEGIVQTWDAASGKRLGLYEVPRTQTIHVAFTKNGLLACGIKGQAISVWDVRAEKSLAPAGGHVAGVTALGFDPDGRGLISVSWDGTVCFWDAAGKETRHVRLYPFEGLVFMPGTFSMSALRLAPDRKHVLGAFNNTISLYELKKGREVCAFSGGLPAYNPSAFFSGDGRLMVEAQTDLKARKPVISLFDVETGGVLRKFEGLTGDLRQLALSPDGKTVAATSSSLQPTGQVNDLRAWDATTGKSLWHAEGLKTWLQGIAFSPDGKVLAALDPLGAISLYEAAGGHELRRLPALPGSTNTSTLTFSPDGRLLAFGAYDNNTRKNRVRALEVASGTVRHEFTGHDGPISAMAFSPDGKRLATGGNDSTILVWDLTGRSDGEVAKGKPTAEELDKLWEALSGADARAAFQAMRRMGAAPEETVALLAKSVKPAGAGGGNGDEIAKLIVTLDDDVFEKRQEAHKQLAALGRSAEGPLKKALAAKPSAEMKRAIEDLLDRLKDKGQGAPPELVRSLRAVEVLEDLGTPGAKKVLEALSKGGAEAPLTAAAREALARLGQAGKP